MINYDPTGMRAVSATSQKFRIRTLASSFDYICGFSLPPVASGLVNANQLYT